MVADLDLASDVLVDDGRADGETVTQRLGSGEDVRVGFLGQGGVRPEGAGAGHAALDLVVVQEGADVAAALGKGHEEFLGGGHDAAFALDGLDDHRTGLFRDERVDGGDVVVGADLETGDHGRERRLVLGVRRGGQGTHGAAVEGILEGDDLDLVAGGVEDLADLAGELDTGLVGFGTGVADEDGGGVVHAARGLGGFDEELGEGAGPGIVVEVGGVD